MLQALTPAPAPCLQEPQLCPGKGSRVPTARNTHAHGLPAESLGSQSYVPGVTCPTLRLSRP